MAQAPIPTGVDPYEWARAQLMTLLQQVQAGGLPATPQQTAAIQAAQAAMVATITVPTVISTTSGV